MTCPKCDGDVDMFMKTPWGNGVQSQPLAPYVCGWCASLFIVNLETNTLLTIEKMSELAGFDVEALLRTNGTLWRAVTETQAIIRGLPHRRPVLR